MARRHEDRRSGERLQRGARGPGGQGGGSGRGGRRGQPGQRRGPTSRRARGVQVTPLPGPERQSDGKLRLNRCLAMAGVCSRRAADEVIQSGRVEVNGKTVTELGVRIDPVADEVRVDGRRLQPEKPVYLLFNKPKGVVCTNARFEQKQRVIDLLPDVRGRIYTV
ncbi:MAG TPA: S4 domain-containing protein, partial [Planctomycetota bacterium]|nr:S4 domain-containing protein [Planctomycetota bacterium]